MRLVAAGAVVATIAGTAPGAFGQAARPGAASPAARSAPTPPPAPETPPEPPPPPYEKDMLRLSEIMGSLAFLRTLCNAADANEWRKRMTALIDAEANSQSRREKLAGAYNKGFRAFALTYRGCTSSANVAIERYLAEGRALSRAIAGRFGG
jgi:uncharacterized protein (TIGR02301 family)